MHLHLNFILYILCQFLEILAVLKCNCELTYKFYISFTFSLLFSFFYLDNKNIINDRFRVEELD